jgi:hypothetical protein
MGTGNDDNAFLSLAGIQQQEGSLVLWLLPFEWGEKSQLYA